MTKRRLTPKTKSDYHRQGEERKLAKERNERKDFNRRAKEAREVIPPPPRRQGPEGVPHAPFFGKKGARVNREEFYILQEVYDRRFGNEDSRGRLTMDTFCVWYKSFFSIQRRVDRANKGSGTATEYSKKLECYRAVRNQRAATIIVSYEELAGVVRAYDFSFIPERFSENGQRSDSVDILKRISGQGKLHYHNLHSAASQLNGINGEATNSDDVSLGQGEVKNLTASLIPRPVKTAPPVLPPPPKVENYHAQAMDKGVAMRNRPGTIDDALDLFAVDGVSKPVSGKKGNRGKKVGKVVPPVVPASPPPKIEVEPVPVVAPKKVSRKQWEELRDQHTTEEWEAIAKANSDEKDMRECAPIPTTEARLYSKVECEVDLKEKWLYYFPAKHHWWMVWLGVMLFGSFFLPTVVYDTFFTHEVSVCVRPLDDYRDLTLMWKYIFHYLEWLNDSFAYYFGQECLQQVTVEPPYLVQLISPWWWSSFFSRLVIMVLGTVSKNIPFCLSLFFLWTQIRGTVIEKMLFSHKLYVTTLNNYDYMTLVYNLKCWWRDPYVDRNSNEISFNDPNYPISDRPSSYPSHTERIGAFLRPLYPNYGLFSRTTADIQLLSHRNPLIRFGYCSYYQATVYPDIVDFVLEKRSGAKLHESCYDAIDDMIARQFKDKRYNAQIKLNTVQYAYQVLQLRAAKKSQEVSHNVSPEFTQGSMLD